MDELKKRIKAAKANLVQCDADELMLLLGKKNQGTAAASSCQDGSTASSTWLQDSDPVLESLLKGDDPEIVGAYAKNKMQPLWELDRFFDFSQAVSDTQRIHVHVHVLLPGYRHRLPKRSVPRDRSKNHHQ